MSEEKKYTAADLLADVQKMVECYGGDLQVAIPVQGMSGSRVSVKGVSWGFDWYAGCLLVNGETPLSHVDLRRYSEYRNCCLEKHSNVKDIRSGKTLIARFQKETKEFTRKHEAYLWLSQKLNEKKVDEPYNL